MDSFLEYLVKGGVLLGHGKLLDMFQGQSHMYTSYNKTIKPIDLLSAIVKHTEQNGWYLWVNKDNGKVTFPFFEALDAYWPGLLVSVISYRGQLLLQYCCCCF